MGVVGGSKNREKIEIFEIFRKNRKKIKNLRRKSVFTRESKKKSIFDPKIEKQTDCFGQKLQRTHRRHQDLLFDFSNRCSMVALQRDMRLVVYFVRMRRIIDKKKAKHTFHMREPHVWEFHGAPV